MTVVSNQETDEVGLQGAGAMSYLGEGNRSWPVVSVAKMLERHLQGILNTIELNATN